MLLSAMPTIEILSTEAKEMMSAAFEYFLLSLVIAALVYYVVVPKYASRFVKGLIAIGVLSVCSYVSWNVFI
ncbi:hypothetical protein BAMA_16285 [Bacillus manliponensis]|uniref:Uncharacterized protein n=1 Tax=Bacillus manliponensis TaxID=574376 RepID=A0A073JQ88_9BACI|nr:hypothetical protein [Bacillus manliponensis]KEK17249.1 hypothetical protein BAMA_16285 [Bacillus manliponensis]